MLYLIRLSVAAARQRSPRRRLDMKFDSVPRLSTFSSRLWSFAAQSRPVLAISFGGKLSDSYHLAGPRARTAKLCPVYRAWCLFWTRLLSAKLSSG